jgi:vancomycin resistance protein VanW
MGGSAAFALKVEALRTRRRLSDLLARRRFARSRISGSDALPVELVRHSSRLIRKVPPEFERLQEGKVSNLLLACGRLDGLVIRPGEVFSFCSTVGRTSRRRGFSDGLEMRQGEFVAAPGGGLCQMANLVYWMALHLGVEILERHRHLVDLFPDDGRTVPFGMGATVFHNYLDLRFRNGLDRPLLLRVRVERPELRGWFMSDAALPYRISFSEAWGRFVRRSDGTVWRENCIVRRTEHLDGRGTVEEEFARNSGRVVYEVPEALIEDCGGTVCG